jgi:hypothetical protein
MENKKLEEFLAVLDSCTQGAFDEKKIQSDIYQILNEIKDSAVWDMLRLACAVNQISFSDGELGEEIARNISETAIEKAVREKNVDDLTTIADELEMSLEFDDLAEEVREIISDMNGISLKIKFDNVKLSLNTSNLIEKSKLVDSFWKNEAPIIKNWSEEEIFFGLYRKVCHLDYVLLRLIPDGEYIFVESIAEYSTYTITYDKFSNFETLKISFEDKFIIINGDVSLKVDLKDIVYKDFIESKLVHFDELGIRVSSEIFHFTKYGDKFEQEKIERQEYMAGSSLDYVANRPIVEFM